MAIYYQVFLEILDSQYQFSDDRLSADEMGKDKIINILLHNVPMMVEDLEVTLQKVLICSENLFFHI